MIHVRASADGLPEGFVDLPRHIYADEPRWIPENPVSLERSFTDQNPWFDAGQCLTLCVPLKARLAVFLADEAVVDDKKTAFFGYWETTGDEDADRDLFTTAQKWARDQGAEYLCGPINFSTYSRYRLLLSAEEGAYPFAGEPFNPPYYPQILRQMGFSSRSEAITQIAPAHTMSKVWRARSDILDTVAQAGIRLEPLSHKTWLDNLLELHGLVDEMFADNFAYTPLTYSAFETMCNESYIRRTDPETSVIAYGPDGSIAGFFLFYPHYGPLLVQEAGDDRVESGDLSFAKHFPALKRRGNVAGIFKTGAVAPAYRKKGLFSALTISAFKWGEGRYDRWFGALVRKDNPSRRYADNIASDSRQYALFAKELRSKDVPVPI